jgi:hypothetical protein
MLLTIVITTLKNGVSYQDKWLTKTVTQIRMRLKWDYKGHFLYLM